MFKEGDEVICVIPTFDNPLILGRLYAVYSVSYNLVAVDGKPSFFEALRFRLATPLNKALSCVSWKGEFFKVGSIYSLDDFDCVYNPKTNYTSAEPWFMYRNKRANFILATDLIIALN